MSEYRSSVESKNAPKAVTRFSRRATWPSSISKKPARKITAAAERNIPVANSTAAQRFTTIPKAVRTLGLMPVAAIASTIFTRSQLLPLPMDRVIINMDVPGETKTSVRDDTSPECKPQDPECSGKSPGAAHLKCIAEASRQGDIVVLAPRRRNADVLIDCAHISGEPPADFQGESRGSIPVIPAAVFEVGKKVERLIETHPAGNLQAELFTNRGFRAFIGGRGDKLFANVVGTGNHAEQRTRGVNEIAADASAIRLPKVQALRIDMIELRRAENEVLRGEEIILAQVCGDRVGSYGGSVLLSLRKKHVQAVIGAPVPHEQKILGPLTCGGDDPAEVAGILVASLDGIPKVDRAFPVLPDCHRLLDLSVIGLLRQDDVD